MSDDEFLESCRAKCREIELEIFEGTKDITPAQQFRTKARMPWYDFCQNSKTQIMPFQEFWNNEETYPRTARD